MKNHITGILCLISILSSFGYVQAQSVTTYQCFGNGLLGSDGTRIQPFGNGAITIMPGRQTLTRTPFGNGTLHSDSVRIQPFGQGQIVTPSMGFRTVPVIYSPFGNGVIGSNGIHIQPFGNGYIVNRTR